jgi:hypothetical protein
MPQGAPPKREKKKPKKEALAKGVRSPSTAPIASAVEVIGKRRKPREEAS